MASRRAAYDEVLAHGLPIGLRVLGVLFGAFAVWHPLELGGRDGLVMSAVAAATAALAVGLSFVTPPRRAHPVAAAVALLALGQVALQYSFTQQSFLVVNVLLVVIGVGVCLVDPRWVAGTVAVCVAAWLGTVAAVSGPDAVLATLPNGALAVGMAVLANTTRLAAVRRLLDVQAELRAQSHRDELTGLLNRRGFLEGAQSLLDRGRPVRVWFIDVDGLKAVNDTRGHDVGDLVLIAVATALGDVFAGGVVARLAGDEFAVAEDHGAPDGERRARVRLHERIGLAGQALGMPLIVSAGTATSSRGQTLSSLLSAADAAMYRTREHRADHPVVVLPQDAQTGATRPA